MKMLTHPEFLERVQAHGKNIQVIDMYQGRHKKIKCKCGNCGLEWLVVPGTLMTGSGCASCERRLAGRSRRLTNSQFIEAIARVNPNAIPLEAYSKSSVHMKFKCKIDGNEWSATPANMLNGRSCPVCALASRTQLASKTHNQFAAELMQINPSIEVLGRYINCKTKIEIKCKRHDFVWSAIPSNLLRGGGCYHCGREIIEASTRKTHDQFISEISLKCPNVFILSKYTNAHKPVNCKCKTCGNQWVTNADNLARSSSCPACSESKGEKLVSEYLDNLKFEYVHQHRFEDCKNKKRLIFDFYLPRVNTCIEYDGIQHFEPIEVFGGEEEFEKSQKRDKIKNKYCQAKGIRLIRIPYTVSDVGEYLRNELLSD